MQQLSGLDASFLYLETPGAPTHAIALWIYDPSTIAGGYSFERMRDALAGRIHLHPRLAERLQRVPLGLDHPYWVHDFDFDLSAHAHRMRLPAPGGWGELCRAVEGILQKPLDLSKSIWELYCIEGLGKIEGVPAGAIALVPVVHHAAVDGMSGAALTRAFHDSGAPASAPAAPGAPLQLPPREPRPRRLDLVGRSLAHKLALPGQAARLARELWQSRERVRQEGERSHLEAMPKLFSAPRTRFNGPVPEGRVFDALILPLEQIRAIGGGAATVNDVVLSICGGGLRRYLQEKGELPAEPLIAMTPVSVREDAEGASLGNKVSSLLVSLRTDVEGGRARLLQIHRDMEAAKARLQAAGRRESLAVSQLLSPVFTPLAARLYHRLGLCRYHKPIFNVTVTNVPGPRRTLYAGGARLVRQFAAPNVMDGVGLVFVVQSYGKDLSISLVSCPDMLPDSGRLIACLRASFEELSPEAPQRRAAASGRAK